MSGLYFYGEFRAGGASYFALGGKVGKPPFGTYGSETSLLFLFSVLRHSAFPLR